MTSYDALAIGWSRRGPYCWDELLVVNFIFCLVISFIDDSVLSFVLDTMTPQRCLTLLVQLLHVHGGLPTQWGVLHMVAVHMLLIEHGS